MRTWEITNGSSREYTVHAVSDAIRKAADGQVVIIKDQTKSDRQRNQFHALCADISRITGYTPAEIKNLIKQDFLGFADVKIAGKMRRVLKSSEDLDRGDYSKLIEYVDLWRSNNGI